MRDAAAKRQAPIEAPTRWRTRGADGSHSPKIARSRPAMPRPLGPPAAPGTISTSAACSPTLRMRSSARLPARIVMAPADASAALTGETLAGLDELHHAARRDRLDLEDE